MSEFEKIAALACLDPDSALKKQLEADFSKMLDFFSLLSGEPDFYDVSDDAQLFSGAKDETENSSPKTELLSLSENTADGFFTVSKTI